MNPVSEMQHFPTTRWSLFEAVGSGDLTQGQNALEVIISRYSMPLKSHIIRSGLATVDDADDLLQEFIVSKLLATKLLGRVDKQRGRFRHFIRRVITDFAIDQIRRNSAAKRTPGPTQVLDEAILPAHARQNSTEGEYDREWGKSVVSEAIRIMEQECCRIERNDLWEVFTVRLLLPLYENQKPEPYELLARRLGLSSDTQASNRLITSKRMFARVVRDVVSEYLYSGREVEDEIRELFEALSNTHREAGRILSF